MITYRPSCFAVCQLDPKFYIIYCFTFFFVPYFFVAIFALLVVEKLLVNQFSTMVPLKHGLLHSSTFVTCFRSLNFVFFIHWSTISCLENRSIELTFFFFLIDQWFPNYTWSWWHAVSNHGCNT